MAAAAPEKRPKPLHTYPADLRPSSYVLAHSGFDSLRYNTVAYLGGHTLLTSGGKFVLFLHLDSGLVESQDGPQDGAVGCVAVHPSRKWYVVGERRPESPLLRAYTWPARAAAQTMAGGAEVGYGALAFNTDGTRLASVASAPDYTLAIWDWHKASLLLRSKCFNADVFTVAFSRFDDALLVTGGAGHIKFWAMADTFTGKKLQAALGKFGRHEISDVATFAVLADGKVLSGSDCGDLLLWEGDLIACTFARAFTVDEAGANGVGQAPHEIEPCHDGAINYVALHGDYVVTAGDDGFMRYWNLHELEVAEGKGLPPFYAPTCVHEACVSPSFRVRSVTLDTERHEWVLLDECGAVATLPYPLRDGQLDTSAHTARRCMQLNGVPLTCAAVSPVEHIAITGGADGVVRCFDYVQAAERCRVEWPRDARKRAAPVTDLKVLGPLSTPQVTRAVVGFGDGTVRLLEVTDESRAVRVVGQWKAHADGLCALAVNEEATQVASVSTSGHVFFFTVEASPCSLAPVGYCVGPLSNPTCAAWDANAAGGHGGCVLGFEGGELLSIHAPAPGSVDHEVGYEFPCEYDLVAIRQRQLPPPKTQAEELELDDTAAGLQEEDLGPWPIAFAVSLPGAGFAVGMAKAELAYVYAGTIRYPNRLELPPLPPTGVEPPDYVEDPQLNICYRDCVPRRAFVSPNGALVVCADGNRLLLREARDRAQLFLLGAAHDSTSGAVTGAFLSYDGSVLVSVGTDGLVVTQLRTDHTAPPAMPRLVTAVEAPQTSAAAAVTVAAVSAAAPAVEAPAASAAEAPALSVQEQKEANDAARAAAEREASLQRFLKKLEKVRDAYADVVRRNERLPAEQRLSKDAMQLDASLQEALNAEKQRRVKEAETEYILATAREDVKTAKLKNRFVDNLLYDRFELTAIDAGFSVASMRLFDPHASIAAINAAAQQLADSDGDSGLDMDDGGDGGDADDSGSDAGDGGGGGGGGAGGTVGEGAASGEGSAAPGGSHGGAARGRHDDLQGAATIGTSVRQQLDKMDARRRERQERRDGYELLLERKPNPAIDDAALKQQVTLDVRNRGECTFRTDAAYRGERRFRPTAAAKLQRMTHLEEDTVRIKTAFNEDLLKLRDEKRVALARLNGLRHEYGQVRCQLGLCAVPDMPNLELAPEEELEKLYTMSREKLDAYNTHKAEERARAEEAKKAQRGFGADLAGAQARERSRGSSAAAAGTVHSSIAAAQKRSKGSHFASSYLERGSRQSVMGGVAMRERMDAELKGKLENVKLTPEEKEEREMQRALLERDMRRLEAAMEVIRAEFNDKLEAMRLRRAGLDVDLCLMTSRLTLLHREYQLLLVFRSQDKKLRAAMTAVKQERESMQRAITSQHADVSTTEDRIKQLAAQLKSTNQAAEAYMDEHCPSDKLAYIKRVYYRQLKRRRRAEDGDDDDDDITSDDDEEEDDDIGEEVRPPNCSVEAWERMLQLREARLDLSDASDAAKAEVANVRKQLERSEHRLHELAEHVKQCRTEMQALEAQKRKELNLLYTVVPLRLSQMRCLEKGARLPSHLPEQPVLVISAEQMNALRQRIFDLADQKVQRGEELSRLITELQPLKESRAAANRLYEEWQAKVNEVMLLKFGQYVDLEMLESCGSSWAVEAKKEELRHLELKWARAVKKIENQIADLRTRLQGKVFDNTNLLQNLGDLELERQQVDSALSHATSKTVQHYRGSTVASKQERSALRELIAAQQEEMDALNAEILMLKRKGGHVYSPGMI